MARAKRTSRRKLTEETLEEAARRTADQAESERKRRRAHQINYLEELPRHADLGVLASDEMWR
ncbi:MAG: hypothetical protein ACRDHO_09015 [Actinomycetota bacterium]